MSPRTKKADIEKPEEKEIAPKEETKEVKVEAPVEEKVTVEPKVKEDKKGSKSNILNSIISWIKNNTKKALIIAAIAVAIVVAVVIILTKFVFKSSNLEYPVLYVENDKLTIWLNENNKKVIDEKFESDGLIVAYPYKNIDILAYIGDSDLYLYDIKSGNKERISNNASESVYFSGDDKYLVYEDEDDNIYYYEIKSKTKNKIASEEDGYIDLLGVIDETVIYSKNKKSSSKKDDDDDYDYSYTKSYYYYDLNKKNNEKIADNINDVSLNNDKTKLYYEIKNENDKAAYIFDIKKCTSDKIISNFDSMLDINEDYNEFIYTVKKDNDNNILDDDEKDNDPVTKVTKKKVCTYTDYLKDKCTYNDWLYDREITIEEVTSKKETNDEIREYAKNIKLYDVVYQKGSKTEVLVENINRVYTANVDNKIVAYNKISGEPVKISTLKSLDEFEDYIKENRSVYVKNKDEEKIDVKSSDIEEIEITKNKDVYLLKENEELFYVKSGNDLVSLDNKVQSLNVKYSNDLLYTVKSGDTENLKSAKESKTEDIAYDARFERYTNSKMYIYNNCNKEGYSCTYSRYDGKLKEIVKDVDFVLRIADDNLYVLKNYSSKNETVDLYKYKNGKLTQIAFDIKVDKQSIYYMPVN